MCRRNSGQSGKGKRRRRLMLLLPGILIPVLLVSTGCLTATVSDGQAVRILVSQIPDLPDIPQWPDVRWSYESGKYCLDEEDADRVLDYLENGVPLYRFEIGQYEEQLRIILDGILSI